MTIPTNVAWVAYRQRRNQPLRLKSIVTREIEQAVSDREFVALAKGSTPEGEKVALVQINASEDVAAVLVLVVGNEIRNVWDSIAGDEAVGVFQRTVVLGQ